MNFKDYTVINDVTKATHWIAKPDNESCIKEFIIPGKAYEVIDQDFILSEDGNLSTYWMAHAGEFIIMNNCNKKLN